MGRPAKALSASKRTVGSNPTLSAMRKSSILMATFLVAGSVLTVAVAPAGSVDAACAKSHVLTTGQSAWKVAEMVKRSTTTTKTVGTISREIQALNPTSSWRVGVRVCLPAWANTATPPPPPTTTGPRVPAVSTAVASTVIRDVFGRFAAAVNGVPDEYANLLPWVAVRIAWHESGLNNRNVNGSGCCVGLFQINYSAHGSSTWLRTTLGVRSKEALKDPTKNTRAALVLFKGRASKWRPGSWCAWDWIVRERSWKDAVRAFPQLAFSEETGLIDPDRATRNKRLLGLSC